MYPQVPMVMEAKKMQQDSINLSNLSYHCPRAEKHADEQRFNKQTKLYSFEADSSSFCKLVRENVKIQFQQNMKQTTNVKPWMYKKRFGQFWYDPKMGTNIKNRPF